MTRSSFCYCFCLIVYFLLEVKGSGSPRGPNITDPLPAPACRDPGHAGMWEHTGDPWVANPGPYTVVSGSQSIVFRSVPGLAVTGSYFG